MKANEVNLNRFLSQADTQFVIPVYQRNYDWSGVQCEQLLNDIFKAGNDRKVNSHFIGSIVYIHDDVYSSSGIRELTIIDGQQRLTTVTLIYAVLLSLAREQQNHQLISRIEETYLINKFAQNEKLKLRPTENNDQALKHLLRSDGQQHEFKGYSRLVDNFNFFRNHINSINAELVQRGLDKLIFVEVSLERGKDDPQRIFESLNSTGLELSQADLIRNYILMGLKPKEQNRIYEQFWLPIETLARDEERNAERVSDLIRDFLTLENREIPNKNKVYQDFKKKYPFQEISELEEVLAKLKRFAHHYNKLLNPQNEPDRDIVKQLKWINKLDVNVAFPFLMEAYDDYQSGKLDKGAFVEVLELVQSFTWRRFVVGLPTNALNKIFMRLHEDVNYSNYVVSLYQSLMRKRGTQRFPRDGEVIATLRERDMYNIRPRNRSYFLERLENFENREPVQIDRNPDITVEHIFPQNPDPNWKITLGEEEFNFIKENYLNTIGNLTLSGNNGRLGNKYFTEKRDMSLDGKEQGYRYSRLWLNKGLADLEQWDKKTIESRFKRIAKRFLQIWKLPDVPLEEAPSEEVNIFDAEDPTYKKLEYAIFFDQKLSFRHVSQLYDHVLKLLFEMEPEIFFSPELSSKLSLTQDESQLRQALKISETYYVEANLDSRSKFERMKMLLSLLELEDELSVKYEGG
ncbi:MAG: DUF262 domain-containing protein [Lewinellaceae bacterium]|nr:DUF262 domain-containing protein [Phaeodactylibacter sp.]MCB9041677.1 DUF262 domain-containing protein [Lewinellaceae bacterium]